MHSVFCTSRLGFFTLIKSIAFCSQKKKKTNLKAYFFFPINQAIYPIYSLSSILAFEVFFLGKFY